jgi:hypothetical protein
VREGNKAAAARSRAQEGKFPRLVTPTTSAVRRGTAGEATTNIDELGTALPLRPDAKVTIEQLRVDPVPEHPLEQQTQTAQLPSESSQLQLQREMPPLQQSRSAPSTAQTSISSREIFGQ